MLRISLAILAIACGVVELSQRRIHQKYFVMKHSCKSYEPCTLTEVSTIECTIQSRQSCFEKCTQLADSMGREYICSIER